MAIDVNEEVETWGGFTVTDFWVGLSVLMAICGLGIVLAVKVSGLLGSTWIATVGGSFVALWVYKRTLPKGYLLRRFQAEGKFLFFKVPGHKPRGPLMVPRVDRSALWKELNMEKNTDA